MNTQITKLGRERLLHLADKLVGEGPYTEVGPVPVKRFNLDIFQNYDFAPDECGTAACACGWAASDPWFRRQYFPQNWDSDLIAVFFGLDWTQVEALFMPAAYRYRKTRPTTVAKRIRKLVAGEG